MVKDVCRRDAADQPAGVADFQLARELLDQHRAGKPQVQVTQRIEQRLTQRHSGVGAELEMMQAVLDGGDWVVGVDARFESL